MQVDVAPDVPRLKGDMQCDIVVVGADMAGLSAA
jgi:monoamine oxidase